MLMDNEMLDTMELLFNDGAKWRARMWQAWQIAGASIALNIVLVWYVVAQFVAVTQ